MIRHFEPIGECVPGRECLVSEVIGYCGDEDIARIFEDWFGFVHEAEFTYSYRSSDSKNDGQVVGTYTRCIGYYLPHVIRFRIKCRSMKGGNKFTRILPTSIERQVVGLRLLSFVGFDYRGSLLQ